MADLENEEYGPELITLIDDEGNEHEFEIIDTLELGEQRYIALIAGNDGSQGDHDDDGELVLLKSVMDGDEEFLEAIEDEAEFDQVAAVFMERLSDSFEFTVARTANKPGFAKPPCCTRQPCPLYSNNCTLGASFSRAECRPPL